MKSQSASLIKNKKITNATVASLLMLTLSLVILAGAFVITYNQSIFYQSRITDTSEMKVLSLQISKNALEASLGKKGSFALLQEARNKLDKSLTDLKESPHSISDIIMITDPNKYQINALDDIWSALKVETDNILSAKERVMSIHRIAITLEETIPQLQIEYDEIIDLMLESNAPTDQIAIAQRQPWIAERIINNLNGIIKGGGASMVSADNLNRDTKLFKRVLSGMMDGNISIGIKQVANEEAIDRLIEVIDLFHFVDSSINEVLEISPELFQIHTAADQIFTDSQQLLQQISILLSAYKASTEVKFINQIFVLGAGTMVLISLLLIAFSIKRDASTRMVEKKSQDDGNQAAIVKLLDEMTELADGNLTVNATVTDGFTGAIADSINYSIEQLRLLVKTINKTAVEVDNAAQKTQSTAHELAEASKHQATEINTATQAINKMAHSIDSISTHATDSAKVAKRSLSIATKGTEVVRNTIEGMNTIKNQIQVTSRRLKSLGESSQEIGHIVSLINEIADQTNILSLNASIQASMAGDAGRGFAVVADEVQRLSERVTAATKQIETLVSTIQTDANKATLSMEQTTTQVVNGALLAQHAGVALEEIEDISSSLASLINNISTTAKTQAASASQISSRMKTIRDITIQTSSGTNATAGSIGDLAEMALEMRKTVSGFRLKETES